MSILPLKELLAVVGGTALVVTGICTAMYTILQKLIFSKIELRQQSQLETQKNLLVKEQQHAVEELKNQLSIQLEQFKQVNASISGVYLSSNQERVNALKEAWQLHLELKRHAPPLVYVLCNLMRREDVLNIKGFNGREVQTMVKEFNGSKYLNENFAIVNKHATLVPFIGLELHNMLSTFSAIVGRISMETSEAILKDGYQYFWLDDEHLIDNIITKVISRGQLSEILSRGVKGGGLEGVLGFIEIQIIENINSQLTGRVFSQAQVQLATEIKNSIGLAFKR